MPPSAWKRTASESTASGRIRSEGSLGAACLVRPSLRCALPWPARRTGPFLSSARLFSFFNDTATTEIYTLSLHDALPICGYGVQESQRAGSQEEEVG